MRRAFFIIISPRPTQLNCHNFVTLILERYKIPIITIFKKKSC